MRERCCVPFCKGNYPNEPSVAIFRFPADEESRKIWLAAIGRRDFVPTSHSGVCRKHFLDTDIKTETPRVKEHKKKSKKSTKRLLTGSIPSVFPDCSLEPAALLSDVKTVKSEAEEERTPSPDTLDRPTSFDLLSESIVTLGIPEPWLVRCTEKRLVLYCINFDNAPFVERCLCIDTNLKFMCYIDEKEYKYLGVDVLDSYTNLVDILEKLTIKTII